MSVPAKARPGDDDEEAAGDEHAPSAESIGVGREPQRDERVAEQGQGQDRPDGQRLQPDRGQVQDEDDGEEPVAEHAQDAQGEQAATVRPRPRRLASRPRSSRGGAAVTSRV